MTSQERKPLIDKIRHLPGQIAELVSGLSETRLTTHFLAGEWTVAQNVHHLADSHMNSYIRCKLILTEEHPPSSPTTKMPGPTCPTPKGLISPPRWPCCNNSMPAG